MMAETNNTAVRVESGATAEFAILVGRVMIGLIFVMSGWPKLLNYSATVSALTKRGASTTCGTLS